MSARRLVPLIIIAIGFALTGSIIHSVYQMWGRRVLIVEQKEELAQLEKQQIELKTQLSRTMKAEFIEEEARNKLGFVKDGETVIILPEATISGQPQKADPSVKTDSILKQWINLFL